MEQLAISEVAYQDFLSKHKGTEMSSGGGDSAEGGRYAHIPKDSPKWMELKRKHKPPETLKLMIEGSLTKEIPETSKEFRQANQIYIKYQVNKAKIKKEYRHFMGKKTTESSDSEYEQKNLKKLLEKKRDKGATSMSVLSQVDKRLKKKKAMSNI